MTHRRITSTALVVLVIACTSLAVVRGQERVENKASNLVKITAENLGVQQCVKPLDDGSQEEHAKPRIQFSVTNVSDETLIIYSAAPSAFDLRLSRKPNDALANSFNYDYRPTFNCAPPFDFGDEPAPTNAFRLLPPGESFSYEPGHVAFVENPSKEKRRVEGDYFIRYRVATWYWNLEKAEILKQRWAPYGRLFYYNLVTEAIPMTINKPGPATPRCDTVPLK